MMTCAHCRSRRLSLQWSGHRRFCGEKPVFEPHDGFLPTAPNRSCGTSADWCQFWQAHVGASVSGRAERHWHVITCRAAILPGQTIGIPLLHQTRTPSSPRSPKQNKVAVNHLFAVTDYGSTHYANPIRGISRNGLSHPQSSHVDAGLHRAQSARQFAFPPRSIQRCSVADQTQGGAT